MEYLLQILVTLVVLYALARAGTVLVSRFGLPGLIGEIIMGVVIANLVIGDFSLMEFLDLGMPAPGVEGDYGSGVYPIVYAMAELGVIFLLFTVGLETKVNDLMKSGKAAFFCALMGVIVPFILGFALIMGTEGNMNHALFLAAAMVATSVGITARIIKDLKLMDTREARIIIAAAVIDDVLGMIVLAIVKGMAESGELSILNVASITLQAVVFVLMVIAICKWVIPRIYDYFEDRKKAKEAAGKVPFSTNKLVLAIIVCLAMAALAEFIGLAAIIDDVLGMIVLAIVKGMAESGELSILNVASITLQAVVFVLMVIAICKWVIPRIYDYFEDRKKAKEAAGKVPFSTNKLVLAIIVCLAMAALAEFIGLAAIIGAFLAGMMFADHAWEWDLESKIDSISTFLLSFFFLNVGLQVDIGTLGDTSVLVLVVVVIILAVISKLVGCSLGAKMGDRSLDSSSLKIIGFGMAPRGEVGIIVAAIGLASGAMSQDLYAVVVLMSVITTIIAPPIISKLFRQKYHEEYKILPEDQI